MGNTDMSQAQALPE
jgi:arginine kinase